MNTFRVWIDEGCIGCRLCAHYCPDVFVIVDESRVRGEARCDGITDGNAYRRAPLAPALAQRVLADVADVVGDCPAQVVRWEGVAVMPAEECAA